MVVIHILLFVVKNLFVNIKLKLLQLHPLTKNIWFRLWLHPNREYTASDILGTLYASFLKGFIMTNKEIWKWLKEQNYQTDYEETGEYKMYYDLDMPNILRAFLEHSKNQRTTADTQN